MLCSKLAEQHRFVPAKVWLCTAEGTRPLQMWGALITFQASLFEPIHAENISLHRRLCKQDILSLNTYCNFLLANVNKRQLRSKE